MPREGEKEGEKAMERRKTSGKEEKIRRYERIGSGL